MGVAQQIQPKTVPHPTQSERTERGRAARREVPRSSLAAFEPATDRPDPVALLESQAETRVPELVPIRYGRMLVSPFAFYRGAALIMAADLAARPHTGLEAQLCGDAHMSNFGVFASPERRLVFDLNDFDETLPGPWEWDVKRLAASFAVGMREIGFRPKDCRATVLAAAAGYRLAMREFAGMGMLDVWYARMEVGDLMAELSGEMSRRAQKRTEQTIAKAMTRDSLTAFSKLTKVVDGEPQFVSDPPLVVRADELMSGAVGDAFEESLRTLFRSYRGSLQHDRRHLLEQYRVVDVARKVVGVGSVGTRAWIVLLVSRDADDPLILQFKEAQPSVLERFTKKSEYQNSGERVVTGQRLMQATSDIFLGWLHARQGLDGLERDFYGRQLKDWKGSFEAEGVRPEGALLYARICGWTLARAHARSGDRVSIAAYLGNSDAFDRAIAEFAEAYADQNQRDYDALVEAVKQGRIEAQTGL
jgi:hypothetical protein